MTYASLKTPQAPVARNRAVSGDNPDARRFTGEDLILYGVAVAHFSHELNDEVREAISWVLLNRRARGDGDLPGFRPEGAGPEWKAGALCAPVGAETARAIAALSRVLAGSVPDPTRGATRFHCHQEDPAWAAAMEIRAAIGPYLFYGGADD